MTTADLPRGERIDALQFPHFPAPFQAVIWRNWNLVPAEVLGKVLGASAEEICAAAEALGLPNRPDQLPLWRDRGFQTIIRRNWELLDYPQLLELLGWTPERLAFTLKEDDFLFHKLGLCKPVCPTVRCRALSPEEAERTAQIRATVREALASAPLTEAPFHFLSQYGKAKPLPRSADAPDFSLKMIYSYSALYGDPLLDDELDSYPEGLLKDYAACGINAVWMQGTLYTLVPWLGEQQPCSRNWERRQQNLRRLVERAGKYGIRVILYFNEPRSMPEAFFAEHPGWKGAPDEGVGNFALCTSVPEVRSALAEGVKRLFSDVPGLGGVFTITMSENLTHCKSRSTHCPRCAERSADELAAEVNNLIAEAMHSVAPEAAMIAYNWAWKDPQSVLKQLRSDIMVMAVSETDLATECLGHKGRVRDYSISKPGPGIPALRIWRTLFARGIPAMAKVQFNSSWELSSLPYIPVPDLAEEHIANLKQVGVSALMLSWTLGGYPGGNLELLSCDRRELAERKFGSTAAPVILKAWTLFSEAFRKWFPCDRTNVLYFAPQNYGPMNLLYPEPTGRSASMIGFPFDDLESWRGAKGNVAANPLPEPIPAETLEEAFRRLAEGWQKGLDELRHPDLAGAAGEALKDLLSVAEAAYCHFQSTYLQIRWVRTRGDREILREERDLALRMFRLVRQDSRLGFEASNHYLYTENDLLEKIINCEHLLKKTP